MNLICKKNTVFIQTNYKTSDPIDKLNAYTLGHFFKCMNEKEMMGNISTKCQRLQILAKKLIFNKCQSHQEFHEFCLNYLFKIF